MTTKRVRSVATFGIVTLLLVSTLGIAQPAPREIVGSLSNFDLHNINYLAFDDLELLVFGPIDPECVTGYYAGANSWGTPAQREKIPGGIRIRWSNPQDPILYSETRHFGISLDPDCSTSIRVEAYWSVGGRPIQAIPVPWQIWQIQDGGVADIIEISEGGFIGDVTVQRWAATIPRALELDELNWELVDDLVPSLGRKWALVDRLPVRIVPGQPLVLEIPVAGQDQAVLVRYEVSLDGIVVSRFINEAILSSFGASTSPPVSETATATSRMSSSEVVLSRSSLSHCVDFEDAAPAATYLVGDTLVDSGVEIRFEPFEWYSGVLTSAGVGMIDSGGQAGGSGQETWLNNITARFGFGPSPNGLTFRFGEYGGNLNIEVNDEFVNFGNFADIDTWVIGGADVSVVNGFGDDFGTVTLSGMVHSFAVGGQELVIDDVCPTFEPLEIYFSDNGEPIGSVYRTEIRTNSDYPVYNRTLGRVRSFAFSPWDRDLLFFVDANTYQIRTVNLGAGVPVESVYYTHTTYVRDIAFDALGRLYFSEASGAGGNGKIWRIETDMTTTLHYTVKLSTVGGFWSGDFAFDPAGTLFLSSGNRVPASIYAVSGSTGMLTTVYTDSSGSIAGLVFDSFGLLFYADWRTRIYSVDLASGFRMQVYNRSTRTWLSDVGFREEEPTGIIPVPGVGTWVMPYGVRNVRLDQIKPTGLINYKDHGSNLWMNDAPFGGTLYFRLPSSNSIPTSAVTYYRIRYKPEGASGWTDFDRTISVHYVREKLGFSPTFPKYTLGPIDHLGKKLYQFRPHEADLPSLVSVAPGEMVYWPKNGFPGDAFRGAVDTVEASLAPGRYVIRIELYNNAKVFTWPGPTTFQFIVPTGVAGDGTILTDYAAGTPLGGFEFTIHVDNSHCAASIDEPTIGLIPADPCGFLRYAPASTTPVNVAFHATHPDERAVFGFRIFRAATRIWRSFDEIAALWASALDPSNTPASWTYAGDGVGNFGASMPRGDLLGTCVEAAFSANLYVYAKATTGNGYRIGAYDASFVRAFALTPE
ncbi:hypothetical protein ACFLS0_03470 [Candidatus Bipolaricaulota bacterium]